MNPLAGDHGGAESRNPEVVRKEAQTAQKAEIRIEVWFWRYLRLFAANLRLARAQAIRFSRPSPPGGDD
jgi:hypothetical protein